MVKLIFLPIIIALSTVWLYFLRYLAPALQDNDGNEIERVTFPSSLVELKFIASVLQTYSVNHWWYVFLIFSSAYIYKQAFCIPGSLFLNILAGALYGNIGGIIFSCVFTATGASVCYFLSNIFARDLVVKYFPDKVNDFQEKVRQNGGRLFYFMLSLRLISVTPGWLVNVAAPLVGVPLKTFFISTLLGLGPYNSFGVSAGGVLSSLIEVNDVFPWKVFLNISIIGLVSLGITILLKSNTLKENKKSS